ncbi:HAMP domain-containing histidine kinase [Streptomyces sp. NBC_00669]|uniref:sensor histidine kinase n=1 Tax=Streptomyces sp. NBC_00669 TaxID=2976011 RepID=UPI002E351B61|nr:HAMP domain-containing sensor histidine kinase [Streptomyces sp. NBC_00669]
MKLRMRGHRGVPADPVTGRRGTSVHRKVLVSIIAVTACAVMVFTLPLAVAVSRIYRDAAVARLQRDAVWAAADVSGDVSGDMSGREAERRIRPSGRRGPSRGTDLAVYGPSGRRVWGSGPASSAITVLARDGQVHQGVERGRLEVAAPVLHDGAVMAVVRVWMPWDPVADSTLLAWLVLAALGAVVVALAALLAWRLARRIATPLERLTAAARALGAGDFTVRPEHTGLREADAVGRALAVTGRRLGELLERERRFSTSVSHQLRTPLTALVLGLESAEPCTEGECGRTLADAARRAAHLGDTVEDLLRLSRDTHRPSASTAVASLLDRVVQRNRDAVRDAGRTLAVRCEPGLPPVTASAAAVVQIMDTLLDNALTHGRGAITVTAADLGMGIALEVGDEGPGPAGDWCDGFGVVQRDGRRHGIGLPLARSLAEAEGGRLVLRRAGPRTVLSLLLPALEAPEAPEEPAADEGPPAEEPWGRYEVS